MTHRNLLRERIRNLLPLHLLCRSHKTTLGCPFIRSQNDLLEQLERFEAVLLPTRVAALQDNTRDVTAGANVMHVGISEWVTRLLKRST